MSDKPVADIFDILDTLPHRYPFLLVDRITAMEPGKWVEGYKNVTFNEPHFMGHFPNEPVMPGVLILEAMAQVGGMLLKSMGTDFKNKLIYFLGIDKAKFRQVVRPGDKLEFKVELIRPSLKAAKLEGQAFVDGKLAASAQFMASVIDKK